MFGSRSTKTIENRIFKVCSSSLFEDLRFMFLLLWMLVQISQYLNQAATYPEVQKNREFIYFMEMDSYQGLNG